MSNYLHSYSIGKKMKRATIIKDVLDDKGNCTKTDVSEIHYLDIRLATVARVPKSRCRQRRLTNQVAAINTLEDKGVINPRTSKLVRHVVLVRQTHNARQN